MYFKGEAHSERINVPAETSVFLQLQLGLWKVS